MIGQLFSQHCCIPGIGLYRIFSLTGEFVDPACLDASRNAFQGMGKRGDH